MLGSLPNLSSANSVHCYSQSRSPTQSLPLLLMTPVRGSSWHPARTWTPFLRCLYSCLRWTPCQPTAEPGYLRPRFCLHWQIFQPAPEPGFFRLRPCLRWLPFQPVAEPSFLRTRSCLRCRCLQLRSATPTSYFDSIYHGLPGDLPPRLQLHIVFFFFQAIPTLNTTVIQHLWFYTEFIFRVWFA